MKPRQGVLRVGDRVRFDGVGHCVVALAGTTVRLRADSGDEAVILLGALLARPDLELLDDQARPRVEPLGLLDALPADVRARALVWESQVIEVDTGRPPSAPASTAPRPGYDPATTTLAQREAAKAAEMTAAGTPTAAVTVQRMRLRYAREGLWGLVDQRRAQPRAQLGRADPRVVAAIEAALAAEANESTGTRDRLRRRVRDRLDADYGAGVVGLPPRTTFYRLVTALSSGQHAFGSAVTRRQLANRPTTPFTPTSASRPGELVQVDTTPLDVLAVLDDGVVGRVELTIILDIATRTIGAGLLRPAGTKAVDAALLLARMLVPEPMRPGWPEALAMSRSALPHTQLVAIDARLEHAAAKPVVVPETIVCDRGKAYLSETFMRACNTLGISLQPAHPLTPTDKGVVERTFGSINTLFCQHVAGYTGSNVSRRGRDVEAVWTLTELQDLFDEWVLAGWQTRPHDGLRNPHQPSQVLSPNEMYAAMVAVAGYVPLTLSGEDYLELLPVAWRSINAYGIQLDHRTYDCVDLDPYRRQPSGVTSKRDLWEVHYDPYDLRQVWLRTTQGWVTAPWTHLAMANAPFADFTWRHARELTAARGGDPTDQAAIAQALDDLLQRAGNPAEARQTRRVRARTHAATATPLRPADPAPSLPDDEEPDEDEEPAPVVPFGLFDAAEEAKRW